MHVEILLFEGNNVNIMFDEMLIDINFLFQEF